MTEKFIPSFLPYPALVLSSSGKVLEANEKISDVFIYGEIENADIFALTGFKMQEIEDGGLLNLERNNKIFKIVREKMDEGSYILCFQDVSNFESLKEFYVDEKLCIAMISVDNYSELLSSINEEERSSFSSTIDKTIRQWATKQNAAIVQFKDDAYMLTFENKSFEKLAEGKFSILDEIREIETSADFPVTLSIGVGLGGKTPAQTDEYAEEALNLALGRGGDQAVIKRGAKIEYYGGKSQTVEKNNKGKSRIVGHALKQLIDQADKVFIMGHKNPDMDSFGSALGIYRLACTINKESNIVINTYSENMAEIFLQAKETDEYNFVNCEKAKETITEDSLVIVLDTHRPSLCECPELLEVTDKIVVIDHHRRAEESIENPTLAYIEPYASSTAELVSEILQFVAEKKSLKKLDAEGLIAGMAIDTNRFSVKTGVRTFEAAAWLRRNGADTTTVRRFFQEDVVSFQIKADCLANAEFVNGGYVISECKGNHPEMQIINSQSADELLEIKGIKASFVLGQNEDGQTIMSARSLGDVNVQLIMEQFGGGGHLTTAGAQVEKSVSEVKEELKALLTKREE